MLVVWAAILLRARWRWVDHALIVNPLLAVALIVVLDVLTRDASPGGQIAFCAPVLYAASQLRATAAAVVLGCTIAGEVFTVLMLKPVGQALTDAGYVSIILVAITVLLTVADVDHFKTVNDTYGHPAGDDALAHVGGILHGLSGQGRVVSRLGGDELAVLLSGASRESVLATAEAFVESVRRSPLRHGGRQIPLSVSAGVGFTDTGALLLRELYAAADASLYDAKRRGRGRVGTPIDAAEAIEAVEALTTHEVPPQAQRAGHRQEQPAAPAP
jgi:diguanylate cyclase (GGDEF)-like protein